MENIDITLDSISINNVDSVLTGPQGEPGFSPIATVTKTGNVATITITDENGTTTATVSDGTDGANGQNNTLTIGTVSSGVTPSATITGTSPNQVLNLVLPKGDTGDDGADGVTPTITIGSTTTVSPTTPASVTNSGTDTAVVLNFAIPQGVQGDGANCLSIPTVVDELPETGDPNTFYFVPKSYTDTTATGTSVSLTIGDNTGRITTLTIKGYLDSSTMEVLTGDIDIDVDGTTVTVPLATTKLANVNSVYEEISNDGQDWILTKRIGYIASYDGETINTDYVSTSGTLTTGDEVYYVLDTPEEITISDPNITDPLNGIRTYDYQTGTVVISTTANVTATLIIEYHTFDINNQYNKYVYVIATSNFEEI